MGTRTVPFLQTSPQPFQPTSWLLSRVPGLGIVAAGLTHRQNQSDGRTRFLSTNPSSTTSHPNEPPGAPTRVPGFGIVAAGLDASGALFLVWECPRKVGFGFLSLYHHPHSVKNVFRRSLTTKSTAFFFRERILIIIIAEFSACRDGEMGGGGGHETRNTLSVTLFFSFSFFSFLFFNHQIAIELPYQLRRHLCT